MSFTPDMERNDIRTSNFTITSEAELGLEGLRNKILDQVFIPQVLAPNPDTQGPVRDRYRAKDMMHYVRSGTEWEDVTLHETQDDRFARLGVPPNDRPALRFHWLSVPGCYELTCKLLSCIPPEMQHQRGTFGVHAFRSFNDVVNAPHQDDFEYGLTYVVALIGGGAHSYLYRLPDKKQVLDHQLQPGEIILFRDSDFLHGATPLTGNPRRRDALVIQFDAPEDLAAAHEELGL
jgi:hypothetical protein